MKLRKIKTENLRSIKNVELKINKSLSLVGPNNVGKSNILRALSIVLARVYPTYINLNKDDFYNRDTSNPIRIYLTFSDLNGDERIHFRTKKRLCMRKKGREPVMYNYSDNLSVCLELPYDGNGSFHFVGDDLVPIRWGNTEDGEVVAVKNNDRDLFPTFVLIPGIRDAGKYFSDSTRYDWGKIINRLRAKINQNSNIQDSLKELTEKISGIVDVQGLRDEVKEHILEFLTEEHKNTDVFLMPVNPGDLFSAAQLVIDDGFKSTLEYKGDGVKSLAVIALLLLASKTENNLIIGFEEPETFLHPSALFVLNTVMQSKTLKAQIIYSSHSPFLVNVTRPKNIVRVYKSNTETKVVQLPRESHWLTPRGEDEIERDIDAQRNMLFFARAVILVEGPTEFLSLPTFASKLGVNLSKKGIVLIEVNGKPNLKNYSDYLTDFKIPHMIVYDIDEEDAPLTESIEALSVPKIPMEFNFEEMLAKGIDIDKLDEILNRAYGETYRKYKQYYLLRELDLEKQIRKFLTKCKPFSAKYIAETVEDKADIPNSIKQVVTKAVALVE